MPNFNYKIIIVIYMVIMSVIGFVSMGIDKKRAINKKWRTPEKTLFIIAFLGGAAGSVLGMRIFKHKTKHMKFVIFMPLFLALQIAGTAFYLHCVLIFNAAYGNAYSSDNSRASLYASFFGTFKMLEAIFAVFFAPIPAFRRIPTVSRSFVL